jgi:hypothetical protein
VNKLGCERDFYAQFAYGNSWRSLGIPEKAHDSVLIPSEDSVSVLGRNTIYQSFAKLITN